MVSNLATDWNYDEIVARDFDFNSIFFPFLFLPYNVRVATKTGIRHDDYDYGEINQLLDRTLKTFIKAACCYPDRITKKDYDSILVELLDSEKVHVNLMVMEAKNQAILLYSLREIMQYMLWDVFCLIVLISISPKRKEEIWIRKKNGN